MRAGWLRGLAFQAEGVLHKVNWCHRAGTRDFIIMGRSQGGAIAFLPTSRLRGLQQDQLPADVRFKTCCSASPKPGNLYYAYEYERATQGRLGRERAIPRRLGVAEVPRTVRTASDFNSINPLMGGRDHH